jgi:hypothetical protein
VFGIATGPASGFGADLNADTIDAHLRAWHAARARYAAARGTEVEEVEKMHKDWLARAGRRRAHNPEGELQ